MPFLEKLKSNKDNISRQLNFKNLTVIIKYIKNINNSVITVAKAAPFRLNLGINIKFKQIFITAPNPATTVTNFCLFIELIKPLVIELTHIKKKAQTKIFRESTPL